MPSQQPQALTDALCILANPTAFRASLIHMARLVALSAHNATPRQCHHRKAA